MEVCLKTRLAVKLLIEISRKASDYLVAKIENEAKATTEVITKLVFYGILAVYQEDEDRIKVVNKKEGYEGITDLALRIP